MVRCSLFSNGDWTQSNQRPRTTRADSKKQKLNFCVEWSKDRGPPQDERAERIYARNAHFRRLIQRKDEAGRNYLRSFFRHWLASRLKRERFPGWQILPKEFVFGDPFSLPVRK